MIGWTLKQPFKHIFYHIIIFSKNETLNQCWSTVLWMIIIMSWARHPTSSVDICLPRIDMIWQHSYIILGVSLWLTTRQTYPDTASILKNKFIHAISQKHKTLNRCGFNGGTVSQISGLPRIFCKLYFTFSKVVFFFSVTPRWVAISHVNYWYNCRLCSER